MKKYVLFRYNAIDEDWLVHLSFDTLQQVFDFVRKCNLSDPLKIASVDLDNSLSVVYVDSKIIIQ